MTHSSNGNQDYKRVPGNFFSSRHGHGGEAEEFVALLATGKLRLRSTLYNVLDDEIYLPVFPSLWLNETDNRFLEINIWWLVSHLTALFTKPSGP